MKLYRLYPDVCFPLLFLYPFISLYTRQPDRRNLTANHTGAHPGFVVGRTRRAYPRTGEKEPCPQHISNPNCCHPKKKLPQDGKTRCHSFNHELSFPRMGYQTHTLHWNTHDNISQTQERTGETRAPDYLQVWLKTTHQAWRSFSTGTGILMAAALALIQSSYPSSLGLGFVFVPVSGATVPADGDGTEDVRFSALPRLATCTVRCMVDGEEGSLLDHPCLLDAY